jgi:hypothetical protein
VIFVDLCHQAIHGSRAKARKCTLFSSSVLRADTTAWKGPWICCALSQSFVLPCALRSMNLVFVFFEATRSHMGSGIPPSRCQLDLEAAITTGAIAIDHYDVIDHSEGRRYQFHHAFQASVEFE